MSKDYFIVNEEPNANILGLDPIILAFHSDELKKITGGNIISTFYELQNTRFRFGSLQEDWVVFSNYLFNKIESDPVFEKKVVSNLKNRSKKINKLCNKTLKRLKKSKNDISEKEKKEIIKEIFSLFISMCVYGLVGPIIEIGSYGVTKKLQEIFYSKTKKLSKINEYMGLLSYSYEESLDQKAQKKLAKIAQKIYKNKDLKKLFLEKSEEIKRKLPLDTKMEIEEYRDDWGWLTYGYMGPDYTVLNVINDIKGMLFLSRSPSEQIVDTTYEIKKNKRKQEQVLKMLKLKRKELYMIKVAQNFTTTKYLRTKMMFLADFTINNLLKSFAEKEGLSMKQIGACTVKELLKYFENGRLPSLNVLNKRLKYCVLITELESEEVLIETKAKDWVSKNIYIDKISDDISEIYGQVACAGKERIIKGIVKIINIGQDMKKFNEGDILVSLATTPEIMPVMKKASAIITDIGGLTCHAAIISRELNIPCIVGTKIATRTLKNGDLVEVDANHGIVRILKHQ